MEMCQKSWIFSPGRGPGLEDLKTNTIQPYAIRYEVWTQLWNAFKLQQQATGQNEFRKICQKLPV